MEPVNIVFRLSELVEYVRAALNSSPYTEAMVSLDMEQLDSFVSELTLGALIEIFPSISTDVDASYEVVFSRYVDKERLFHLLRAHGQVDYEEVVCQKLHPLLRTFTEERVRVIPGTIDLCFLAFDEFSSNYIELIESMITNICPGYNPYAEVTYCVQDDLHIVTMKGDIRHRVFKELFGDRYSQSRYERLRHKGG